MDFFIFDFDSTIIKTEGLDELAKIILENNPDQENLINKITETTNLGMEGKISFTDSLTQRLALLSPKLSDIERFVGIITTQLSDSVERNKRFFEINKDKIFIISGGFLEFILPVTRMLEIPDNQVFANSFVFNEGGEYQGVDTKNPLAYSGGKVKVAEQLGLVGNVLVIGDGYTDFEIKKSGFAKFFAAFTENVKRESVMQVADYSINSMDELLTHI